LDLKKIDLFNFNRLILFYDNPYRMTTIRNLLSPEWKDVYDSLGQNYILKELIESMFYDETLNYLQPESFINGEIESQFFNDEGLTTEQIIDTKKNKTINIIDLINKVYTEMEVSNINYNYFINRKENRIVELTITEVETLKSMLIEFTVDLNHYVIGVFIKKNNLFHGYQNNRIFQIFTSKNFIKF